MTSERGRPLLTVGGKSTPPNPMSGEIIIIISKKDKDGTKKTPPAEIRKKEQEATTKQHGKKGRKNEKEGRHGGRQNETGLEDARHSDSPIDIDENMLFFGPRTLQICPSFLLRREGTDDSGCRTLETK